MASAASAIDQYRMRTCYCGGGAIDQYRMRTCYSRLFHPPAIAGVPLAAGSDIGVGGAGDGPILDESGVLRVSASPVVSASAPSEPVYTGWMRRTRDEWREASLVWMSTPAVPMTSAMAVRTMLIAIVWYLDEMGGRMADDHLCGGIGVVGAGGGAIQYEVGV